MKIRTLKKYTQCFSLCAAVLALSACAHKQPTVNTPSINVPITSADAQTDTLINQAASSVSQSLTDMSATQTAAYPGVKVPPPLNAKSTGLSQTVTINWNGPVAPLLRKITETGHYKFQVIGKNIGIPALVSVNMKNATLASALRNIRYQVAQKADLIIYPKKRLVELRYFGA